MSLRTITALFTFLFICLPISKSGADALDEVLRSPILQNAGRETATGEMRAHDDAAWFAGKSNLRRLFATREEDKGPLYLLEWFGELATAEYSLKSKTIERQEPWVGLTLNYQIPNNAAIKVEILAPHPLHRDQANLGLISVFAALEPPRLSASSFEQIQIRNLDAMFYHHKEGKCSLLFKLASDVRLNLVTDNCADAKHLISIAEQSDLTRLNYKLDT